MGRMAANKGGNIYTRIDERTTKIRTGRESGGGRGEKERKLQGRKRNTRMRGGRRSTPRLRGEGVIEQL